MGIKAMGRNSFVVATLLAISLALLTLAAAVASTDVFLGILEASRGNPQLRVYAASLPAVAGLTLAWVAFRRYRRLGREA